MANLFKQNNNFQNLLDDEVEENRRQLDFYSNIITPEFLEQERSKGKSTLMQSAQNAKKWGYAVPYAGSTAEASEDAWVNFISNKVRRGETLTRKEYDKYKNFIQDMASESVRGATLPANIFNGILTTFPYLVEMGIGFAAAGTGVGLSSIGYTGSKIALRQLAKKGVKDITRATVNRQIAKNLIKGSTLGIAKMGFKPQMWINDIHRYQEVQLQHNLYLTPDGYVTLNEAEQSPAKAFLKTVGKQWAEMLSETAGFAFHGVGKWMFHGMQKRLPKSFVPALNKLIEKSTGLSPVKALKKYGWNGVVEEMGEERVGDFLQVLLNLDDQGRSFEQFAQALYPGKDQLVQEAITFALTGGLMGGAVNLRNRNVKNKVYKEIANNIKNQCKTEDGKYDLDKMVELIKANMPDTLMKSEDGSYYSDKNDTRLKQYIKSTMEGINNTEDYTVDDFLLDSGAFRKNGRLSNVDRLYAEILDKTNITDDEKRDLMNFESTADKIKTIHNFLGQAPDIEDVKNTIKEIYKKSGKLENIDEDKLDKISTALAAITDSLSRKSGQSVNEIAEKYLPSVAQLNGYVYADEDGNGITGDDIKNTIDNLKQNIGNLYNDETQDNTDAINQILSDIELLENMQDGNLPDEHQQRALNLITTYNQKTDNAEVHHQSADNEGVNDNKTVTPVNIDGDSVPNLNKVSDLKKWIYENLPLLGTITIKSENRNVQFSKKAIDRSLKGIYRYPVKRNSYAGLKELVENSIFGGEIKADDKHKDKVTGQELYYNALTYNGETYGVKISVDIPKQKNTPYTYAGHKIEIMKAPAASEVGSNELTFVRPEATISINDIKKLFNPNVKNGNTYFQSAYHGTRHRFDEFSTEHIGEGEGFQAHGWGLYFAADKNVSEEYRKNLGTTLNAKYNGKSIGETELGKLNDVYRSVLLFKGKNKALEKLEQDKKNAEKNINGDSNFLKRYSKKFLEKYDEQLEILKNVDESKITDVEQGQLYEVDIPEDDELLDENKSLSEQSEKVQKALDKFVKDYYDNKYYEMSEEDKPYSQVECLIAEDLADYVYDDRDELTGKKIYDIIEKNYYDDSVTSDECAKSASLFLNKLGVKGITYVGAQDGRCYVIFDDKAVKVLNKYYQGESNQLNINPAVNKVRKLRLVKGGYIPVGKFIELYKNADPSTIIHEVGHWWLNTLTDMEKNGNDEITQDMAEIRKYLKNDGSPFTEEQHEKFARGFENYIRTGNARSNRLKRIFEDFKNFLLSIYDNIKNIGTDDETSELAKLFDQLLTTEHERIQKTVFDKCIEIDERIQKIKNDEQQEIDYIYDLHKNSVSYTQAQEKLKNRVNELLKTAENKSSQLPKEVKEWQKRFKAATYAILETATGMDIKQIANPKNEKKVRRLIETTDKITASGEKMQEWIEFYSNKYDEYDTDSDAQLAEEAFENLKNKAWEQENDKMTKWFGKFEYLQEKAKKAQGVEKTATLEALAQLFDEDFSSMPDEAMDYINEKFNEINETINENNENSPFEKYAKYSTSIEFALRAYVMNKLHNTKIYDNDVKRKVRLSANDKLFTKVQNANTPSKAERVIKEINQKLIDELQLKQKSLLHREIQKQIKVGSKLVKVGNIKKGKFDWKTNTIFAELKEINKMKQEAVEKYKTLAQTGRVLDGEMREGAGEAVSIECLGDESEQLKRMFIDYRSVTALGNSERSKLKELDVTLASKVLEGILRLKSAGRNAKNAEEFKKAFESFELKNDLIEQLDNIKNNRMAKYVARWIAGDTVFTSEATLANWETLLNALFGKENAQRYSLLADNAQVEVYARKHVQMLLNGAAKIYGFTKSNNIAKRIFDKITEYDGVSQFVKLMQEYEKEKITATEYTYSNIKDENGDSKKESLAIEITRGELITLYAWALNKHLQQRLVNQFGGADILNGMFEKLSEKDKRFAHLMIDVCESMYPDTNEVFINTTGLSLTKVDNYMPSVAERVLSDMDMLHESLVRSNNPSFTNDRKKCTRIKMKIANPLGVIMPHINKTARYVILSEKLNKMNKIFKGANGNTIKAKIYNVFGKQSGKKIWDKFINTFDSMLYPEYNRAICCAKNLLDTASSNYVTAAIGGNAKVCFNQLTSCINYSENMPVAKWSAYFAKNIAHPVETVKYMLDNCEYLKARLGGNSQNEIVQKITTDAGKFRGLRNFFTANTRYGDIGAIIFGGKPYVDYLINEKGMSEKEAFKMFTEATLRAQQSGHDSATSLWQKNAAQNPLSRMFFAFNNTSMQYERKFADSVSQLSKGEISTGDFIKSFVIYKVLNPVMYTSIVGDLALLQLVSGLMGGGDDNPWGNFGISAGTALLLSQFKAYGYLGFVANAIISLIVKKALGDKYFKTKVPVITDVENVTTRLMSKGLKGELTFADYVNSLSVLCDYISGGVPVKRLVNTAGGVYDLSQGDPDGWLRLMGYSDYKAHEALGLERSE